MLNDRKKVNGFYEAGVMKYYGQSAKGFHGCNTVVMNTEAGLRLSLESQGKQFLSIENFVTIPDEPCLYFMALNHMLLFFVRDTLTGHAHNPVTNDNGEIMPMT
jgi:hypothetical protein